MEWIVPVSMLPARECAECQRLKAINADLLAACKACERVLIENGDPMSGEDQDAMHRIRAAIAKAEPPQ